jgi:hypothetical protein
MQLPIHINTSDLNALEANGVSKASITTILNARNLGAIFKNKNDLAKIGLPPEAIEKIYQNVSFEISADPLKSISVTIEPLDIIGYWLVVTHQDPINNNLIEEIFPINTGVVTFKYQESEKQKKFDLSIKSPAGNLSNIQIGDLKGTKISMTIDEIEKRSIIITKQTEITTRDSEIVALPCIKGKLISNNANRKLDNIKLVVFVSNLESPNDDDFFPVCYAITESEGYFLTNQPRFPKEVNFERITKAFVKTSIEGILSIPIRLEFGTGKLGKLPATIILFVNEQNIGNNECHQCGCNELNFINKKVIEEFSFYSVVRTTEPLIEAIEIDEEEISLEKVLLNIVDDGNSKNNNFHQQIVGITLPKTVVAKFNSNNQGIKHSNFSSLIEIGKQYKISKMLASSIPKTKCRLELDGSNKVDWDEKPTIYQSTSIAHGHLLQFKQEWFSDGYSLGDLLYSLPLAPGQKKQIVVFDWDRKDSASNTQQLDYQESLYNSLSRDRDVNDVASSMLTEKTKAGSVSASGSYGFIGVSGSASYQSSSRAATANSFQHVNDRTVQAGNATRNQRATVIQTVSQGERFQVSAEVIANYNHCHAMTMQYFEVLRHFEIKTRLANVQECLFIPLAISPFDENKALRWRNILAEEIIKKNLSSGFDALERKVQEMQSREKNYYESIGFPKNTFAEEMIQYLEGELFIEIQLTRPKDTNDDSFDPSQWLHLSFLGRNFYDLFLKGKSNKDEAFAKNAGPAILQNIMDKLKITAVTKKDNTSHETDLKLEANLMSDFKNKTKLNVSLRMTDSIQSLNRKDIDFISISLDETNLITEDQKKSFEQLRNETARVIVHSGSMRFRTANLHEYLFNNSRIKNDLGVANDAILIFTPLSEKAMRRPIADDVETGNALLHHLNENLEYYHQQIWMQMDPQRRFMLLDGIKAPGKANGRSVASVVENKLIGIVGNCLVLPVSAGFQLDPLYDNNINLFEHYYADPTDSIHLSLPTKGVYAEAIMGKCNSCEEKEDQRFWRWEESPIPDSPTTINPVSLPTPQDIQPNLQVKDFPNPSINIQNAPQIPDPQGYGKLVDLLGKSDLFKDITGLSENQKNAMAAYQLQQQLASGSIDKVLSTINKAKDRKDITPEQANALTNQALDNLIGGDGKNNVTETNEKKIAIPGNEISVPSETEKVNSPIDSNKNSTANPSTDMKVGNQVINASYYSDSNELPKAIDEYRDRINTLIDEIPNEINIYYYNNVLHSPIVRNEIYGKDVEVLDTYFTSLLNLLQDLNDNKDDGGYEEAILDNMNLCEKSLALVKLENNYMNGSEIQLIFKTFITNSWSNINKNATELEDAINLLKPELEKAEREFKSALAKGALRISLSILAKCNPELAILKTVPSRFLSLFFSQAFGGITATPETRAASDLNSMLSLLSSTIREFKLGGETTQTINESASTTLKYIGFYFDANAILDGYNKKEALIKLLNEAKSKYQKVMQQMLLMERGYNIFILNYPQWQLKTNNMRIEIENLRHDLNNYTASISV